MTARPLPPELVPFTTPRRVLDHGHVMLVDVMGDDERIEQVARLSYEGGRSVTDRRGLLRYLLRHRHTSPFEQVKITLDIRLPIFVARQLVRHRMQALNEVSARYTELPADFYVPEPSQVCEQDPKNKQGRAEPLSEELADAFREGLTSMSRDAHAVYGAWMKNMNVARETARFVLPLATYTHWVTTWDLHNLFHMLKLRTDPHAQWEIREFANAIAEIVQAWCPLAFEAWVDYSRDARTFSRQELDVLRFMVKDLLDEFVAPGSQRAYVRGLFESCDVETQRERAEFLRDLGIELPKES